MASESVEPALVSRPEDPLPVGRALLLGLQHVLAMDVYVVPFVIAAALGLSVAETARLVQAAFFAAGLATIVQSQFGIRLPVVQGPSYVPIGAVLAIAFAAGGGTAGLSAVFGALLPGAVLLALAGTPTGLVHRAIGRMVPPLVGGTIILVVGIGLMPVALQENIFARQGAATIGGNILLAGVSAGVLVAGMMAGIALGRKAVWLRTAAVILALAAGCVLAGVLGRVDGQAVAAAPWLTRPRLAVLDFALSFSLPAILTMIVVYLVILAETAGTWFAVGAVTGETVTDRRLDRGATGEGLGCLLSALLGSTPVTGYSSNAGIIAITGIASRSAFAAAGALLIVVGSVGKLSAAIASIPGPVIGGIFGVLCAVIAMNGFRVIRAVPLTERNMLVVGLPILLTLFAGLMPADYLRSLPTLAQYFLGSSIAVGSIAAIVLNLILPADRSPRVS